MRAIEVIFTINEETGELTADVVGAQGTECLDKILAGLEKLLGDPTKTVKKPEYHREVRRSAASRYGVGQKLKVR